MKEKPEKRESNPTRAIERSATKELWKTTRYITGPSNFLEKRA